MHLVDHARAHIEKTYTRPLADRLLRALLASCCPIRRASARRWLARLGRPFARLFARVPALEAASRDARRWRRARAARARVDARRHARRPGTQRGRVALLDRLRPAGARPRHQRGDDPPADPARRRGGGAAGRGLLRRARPSHGPRGRRRSPRRGATSTPGRARSRAAGSTPSSSPRRAAARRSRTTASCCASTRPMPSKAARVSALAKDITEYPGDARPAGTDRASRASPSPIIPPARCSTARRSRGSRRTCCAGRLHREGAARRASLLRLGRHLQHPAAGDLARSCATARSTNIAATGAGVVATGNIGCITQIASAARHAGRPHGRTARLGLWRRRSRRPIGWSP